MTAEEVLAHLRAELDSARSRAAWCRAHGVSYAYVSDVLSRAKPPSERLLAAIGLERRVTFTPIPPGTPGVALAPRGAKSTRSRHG